MGSDVSDMLRFHAICFNLTLLLIGSDVVLLGRGFGGGAIAFEATVGGMIERRRRLL